MMVRHLDGKVNVNDDPYGASPLRMRLYYSGMAIAALLDALGPPSWHESILQPDTTLTSLAHTAIAPQASELETAIAAIPTMPDYEALCAEKSQLRDAGMQWIKSELESIERGTTTSVVIDYSLLKDPNVAMSFTPFGIVAVDNDRTIFRLVPISAKLRAQTRFEQTRPAPVLQDRKAQRFTLPLTERVSREQLLEALQCDDLPEGPTYRGGVGFAGREASTRGSHHPMAGRPHRVHVVRAIADEPARGACATFDLSAFASFLQIYE